jgi:hypothetical protein
LGRLQPAGRVAPELGAALLNPLGHRRQRPEVQIPALGRRGCIGGAAPSSCCYLGGSEAAASFSTQRAAARVAEVFNI